VDGRGAEGKGVFDSDTPHFIDDWLDRPLDNEAEMFVHGFTS
jgi:hypothetical protein